MTVRAGDPDVAAWLERSFGTRAPVAAATVTPGHVQVASIGAPVDATFEIGSISKGITGLLYADGIARGEIGPRTTLGDLLPLGDSPAARVTLASVSTHHSGLPSVPSTANALTRLAALWVHGTNPYRETVDELLAQARTVQLRSARARYSNLGYQLLGHAVARAAGTSYAGLVRDRITAPLGLRHLTVPATPDELGPTAIAGRSRRGRLRAPWTGEALGPAGGIRASVTDLAVLAQAMLSGAAPGIGALDPTADFGRSAVRIGAAWITIDVRGRLVTWHNGGTGGFRSWFGLDRDAGTAVAVLAARHSSVDRHGFALLSELASMTAEQP